MPAILPGYEYDIFISYRQKDNRPSQSSARQVGWVTEFVESLRNEIEATFKEDISIYFDENPHDGLHDHHDVDDSLKKKLKCLIFIPIVSRTYCDTESFAWKNEFKIFLEQAKQEELGLKVNVSGGNVASRVLPIRIYELPSDDVALFEKETGSVMRSIDFIYKETGVNRPLESGDDRKSNDVNLDYKNQINKVANAIDDIIKHIKAEVVGEESYPGEEKFETLERKVRFIDHLRERNVIRAGIMYILLALLGWKVLDILTIKMEWSPGIVENITLVLIIAFPIATAAAWLYEWSPKGLVRIGSENASDNPYSRFKKKPLTSNAYMGILLLTFVALLFIFPGTSSNKSNLNASQSSVAVLPFVNNTGDSNLDYYGMGMASEISTQLSLAKNFDFISSMQATSKFKGSNESPADIGKQLGVTHLVSGLYMGNEENLQVVVELVDCVTGKIVWSLPVKTQASDFFDLQSSIGSLVMERFNTKGNRKQNNYNLQAYAEAIRGADIANSSNSPGIALEAVPYFERAIQMDSTIILAWQGLIMSTAYYYQNIPSDTIVTPARVRKYVDYVRTHFDEGWEKNEILAVYEYQVEKNFDEGIRLFEKALEENPDAEGASGYLAAIYRRKMQYNKALPYSIKQVKLLNNIPQSWTEIGVLLHNAGDVANAEQAFKKAYELNSDITGFYYRLLVEENRLEELPQKAKENYGNRYTADLLLQNRNYDSLIQFLQTTKVDTTFDRLRDYYFAVCYFLKEDVKQAREFASNWLKLISENEFWYQRAITHGILGNEINGIALMAYNEKQLSQDLQQQGTTKYAELFNLIYMDDFEGATTKLKEINIQFPNFGRYSFLNMPEFDKIKSEYPPFQEAINSLRIPPPPGGLEQIKM